jgi:hypothetical protein
VQRDFCGLHAGIQHFRKEFPGFTERSCLSIALARRNGRRHARLGGKTYLIFGADVIAQIHDAHDLTPFLDHELFHVETASTLQIAIRSGARCGPNMVRRQGDEPRCR